MDAKFNASTGTEKPITKEMSNLLGFKIKDFKNMDIKFKKNNKMKNQQSKV